MVTEIATIAAAITALIGLGYKIYSSIKQAKEKKHIEDGRTLEQKILGATTDEERAKLIVELINHNRK